MLYLIIYLVVVFLSVSIPFLSIWIIDNIPNKNLAKFINKYIIYYKNSEKK